MTETAKAFLVLASLFFYSWWNVAYLPLILFSMLFNYMVGVSLSRGKERSAVRQKVLLTFGIIANVSLLGYFKYMDFFIENINLLLDTKLPLLHLALPLAISFFTFQQIAYLVDSYKDETKEYNFLNYANFVTFFPQLIAGPIVHHTEMMPQFAKLRNKVKNYQNIALGLFIFSMGLFKKVVIADTFAIWARAGFDTASTLNLFEAWATSLSYTFQLYFDFSGYTDMAIGAALLFNIKLPINFNSPYKALSIQDFWRRWHITLSRFLRDYIYIPLGGNRKGEIRTYTNLMITFIVGGIWHGAGWTFIFWGFLHGLALLIHRAWSHFGLKMHTLLAWFVTFNFVNIAWIFFRAKEWSDAAKVLGSMFSLDNVVFPHKFEKYASFLNTFGEVSFAEVSRDIGGDGSKIVIWITVIFILLGFKNTYEITSYPNISHSKVLTIPYAIFFAFLFVFSVLYISVSSYSEFIYFNF